MSQREARQHTKETDVSTQKNSRDELLTAHLPVRKGLQLIQGGRIGSTVRANPESRRSHDDIPSARYSMKTQ